jgi:serine/threonine protein phosphatase PrpC
MSKMEPTSWLRSSLLRIRRGHNKKASAESGDPRFAGEAISSSTYEWRVVGRSVRGASHLRSGLPNQDAIGWDPESGKGPALIVAVSDGHGSAKYFRSDKGAEFAVRAALAECRHLIDGQPDFANLSAIKRTAEERLPQAIVRHWGQLVEQDAATNPVTPDELDLAVAKATSPVDRNALETTPTIWYGATLLAAIVTNAFTLFLRLGDGDILTVFEADAVTRPLPQATKEESVGDDTQSLCLPNAWRDFALTFQALSGSSRALVLITTDGYQKSFTDDAGFLKLGSDIFELIRREGLAAVDASLESWLNEASTSGSGDDITVALVYRGPEAPEVMEAGAAGAQL